MKIVDQFKLAKKEPKRETYRYNSATGEVYEWNASARAYVYIGNTHPHTSRAVSLKTFIKNHEEQKP